MTHRKRGAETGGGTDQENEVEIDPRIETMTEPKKNGMPTGYTHNICTCMYMYLHIIYTIVNCTYS